MNEATTQAAASAMPAPVGASIVPKAAKPAKAKAAKKAAPSTKAKGKPAKAKAAKKAKKPTDGEVVKGPGVLRQYAPQYHKDTEKKTSGGHVSVDCNDDLAAKLRGKALEDVYALASKTLEVPVKDLMKRYSGLNVGMQRMNLGNRIRGVLNAK